MNFSAILDISSFFIGMIINLLLIALICYYFKRKYENLEIAQNEQAKVLYQLLQQNSSPKVMNMNDVLKDLQSEPDNDSDTDTEDESITNTRVVKSSYENIDADSVSCSDSGSDDESCTEKVERTKEIKTISLDKNDFDLNIEMNEEKLDEIKVQKLDEKVKKESKKNDIEDISINSINVDIDDLEVDLNEKDYSKMNIKQLKEILSVKGINPTKMKKNEMIELIEKSSATIDESN